MYTDFALFTLPIRGPKISDEFLTKLAIDPKDRMDCDEDEEDRDYLVSSAKCFFNGSILLCQIFLFLLESQIRYH
jgi:hypothetical protein